MVKALILTHPSYVYFPKTIYVKIDFIIDGEREYFENSIS